MREPRLAASVDHPNIISVYEVGEEDGQLFLAMQWIDGEDLGTLIEKRRRLPPERRLDRHPARRRASRRPHHGRPGSSRRQAAQRAD